VDSVHNLLDDVAEQHEIADELSDALSNAVGFSQDISDVISIHAIYDHGQPGIFRHAKGGKISMVALYYAKMVFIKRYFCKTTQISVSFLHFEILNSRQIYGFHCTSKS